MKAAQISTYGDATAVTVQEVPQPSPGAGQVLVEVHAASLNPFDSAIRAGFMKDAIPLHLPVTLGGDIAGTITQLGEGVTGLAVGDTVYGQANVVAGNSGALAEYAVTAAAQVAKMPAHLTFEQAAALPLVGISALQALTETINLASGQNIFIHGGSGGIGAVAIQIAKHLGAHVATTATGEGSVQAKNLGADEVIDYKTQDFAALLTGYDAVFDTVGDDFAKTLTVLRPGGIAVSMAARPDAAKAAELGVAAQHQMTQVSTERLNHLTELIEAGVVTPHIAHTFALADVVQAFQTREAGGQNGKIVIKIA